LDVQGKQVSQKHASENAIWLNKILKIVNKPINEWDRRDVRRVINHYTAEYNQGKITQTSVEEIKKTLKKFFKWASKSELVNWFSLKNIETKVSQQDLITQEEFEATIGVCRNSRDRALISLLYESGARIGEIGSMRIKDVSFDEYGAIVCYRGVKHSEERSELCILQGTFQYGFQTIR